MKVFAEDKENAERLAHRFTCLLEGMIPPIPRGYRLQALLIDAEHLVADTLTSDDWEALDALESDRNTVMEVCEAMGLHRVNSGLTVGEAIDSLAHIEVDTDPHTIDPSGEFCSCGQDAVTCQVCGQRVCGTHTGHWEHVPGREHVSGNVCQDCMKKANSGMA